MVQQKRFLYFKHRHLKNFFHAAVCDVIIIALFAHSMIPNPSQKLDAVSQLNENLQPLQGFGIEILQTVIVTIAWLATYVTSKSQLGSSALPVGIAYLANSLWAVSKCGGKQVM